MWTICFKKTKDTQWRSNECAKPLHFIKNSKDEHLHLSHIERFSIIHQTTHITEFKLIPIVTAFSHNVKCLARVEHDQILEVEKASESHVIHLHDIQYIHPWDQIFSHNGIERRRIHKPELFTMSISNNLFISLYQNWGFTDVQILSTVPQLLNYDLK